MKAAVITSASVLEVKEINKPNVGPYDALCQTLYGAVCTGTDSHLLHFEPPFCHWIGLPAILGHESVGRVIEVGEKVKHIAVGDILTRVGHPGDGDIGSAWGGFAEYTIGRDWQAMKEDGLPEGEWHPLMVNRKLPEGVPAADGTMFITWRETLSYVNRIGVSKSKNVLIIGSGSNGLAMALHAFNLGANKVVMVGSGKRSDEAKRCGCAALIDYKADDAKDQALSIAAQGFDVAIDVIGTTQTANLALSCLTNNGVMGIYGLDGADSLSINPSSAGGKTFTVYQGGYDEGETHEQVCDFYQMGKLDASIWIDETKSFTLDNIVEAFEAAAQRDHVKPLIAFGK